MASVNSNGTVEVKTRPCVKYSAPLSDVFCFIAVVNSSVKETCGLCLIFKLIYTAVSKHLKFERNFFSFCLISSSSGCRMQMSDVKWRRQLFYSDQEADCSARRHSVDVRSRRRPDFGP